MTDTPDIGALVAEARLTHLDMKTVSKEHVNPLAAKLADALEAQQAVVVAAREWRKDLEKDVFHLEAIRSGVTHPGIAKLMKALAALDAPKEGEG